MSEEAQSDHSADSVVTWLLPSWTMLHPTFSPMTVGGDPCHNDFGRNLIQLTLRMHKRHRGMNEVTSSTVNVVKLCSKVYTHILTSILQANHNPW